MRKKLLIVEDSLEWRRVLVHMYQELLDGTEEEFVVQSTDSGTEAKELFRRGEHFELLSIDINLGHQDQVHGFELLRVASEECACNGVVVITAAARDEELPAVVRDEGELRVIRQALSAHLERLFPGHNLKLDKSLDLSVEDNIEFFRQFLPGERLIQLAAGSNRLCCEGHGVWIASFQGKSIRVKESDGVKYVAALLRRRGEFLNCLEMKVEAGTASPTELELSRARAQGQSVDKDGVGDPARGRAGGGGNVDDKRDAEALRAYVRQMRVLEIETENLEDQMAEAQSEGLSERVEDLAEVLADKTAELRAIQKEIKATRGFGSTKSGVFRRKEEEQLRHVVSKRVHGFLKVLATAHPALHQHLTPRLGGCLHIGYRCSYQGDQSWDA